MTTTNRARTDQEIARSGRFPGVAGRTSVRDCPARRGVRPIMVVVAVLSAGCTHSGSAGHSSSAPRPAASRTPLTVHVQEVANAE
jgi:hypothetical protein